MARCIAFLTVTLLMLQRGLSASEAPETENTKKDKPNILLILADDLGYSDLGCYGGEIETPHIDQLAREGVRFTGLKNTSRCAPSRASLLTGRYQHSVDVGDMTSKDENRPGYRGQLSSEAPTIAEILKPHGYGTSVIGKWHLTIRDESSTQKQLFPLDRGFDFFYGTTFGAKDYFSPKWMMKNAEHISNNKAYEEGYYLTEDFSDTAIDFVESQIADKRPFFLYLAHYAPHAPIQAPESRIQKCFDRYMTGFEKLQQERFVRQKELGIFPEHTQLTPGMNKWDDLNHEKQKAWATVMATYAAMIEIMDDGIGQLIQVLKKHEQYDNTLILFLSDNGSTSNRKGDKKSGFAETFSMLSNTPFRGKKADTLEGGIASPLIISWPRELKKYGNSIRHGHCHIIDALPICLDAANVDFPSSFNGIKPKAPNGISLMAAAKGAALPARAFYWEHKGSRAVFQQGWKLIANSKNAPWALYNLNEDPIEQNDLAGQHPERVGDLLKLWENLATENNVLPLPGKNKNKPENKSES
ncbi:MAG: arylsulfatase [Verrucomicrobiota bacterium]